MMLDFLSVSFWIWMLTRIGASERCDDWGVDYTKQVWAYDGEPTRIKCPLYLEYLKHNYSTVHSTGLTLMWYCMRQNQELEEPINFRVPGNRISKEKDTVWFRPAVFNDTGNYTCMLRNTTHCSKVAFPLNVIKKDPDSCHSLSQKFYRKRLYYEEEGKLECPDTDGFYPPTEEANITWYHNCIRVDRFVDRYIKDKELVFTTALAAYLGNYTCVLSYFDHGKRFSLTRTITVEMKASPNQARAPTILIPSANQSLTFAVGDDAVLICSAFFSFLETSPSDVWWTINEQKVENISNPRISTDTSVEELSSGDKVIKVTLTIQDITQEELKSKFFCHAENTKGSRKSEAIVQQKFHPDCKRRTPLHQMGN